MWSIRSHRIANDDVGVIMLSRSTTTFPSKTLIVCCLHCSENTCKHLLHYMLAFSEKQSKIGGHWVTHWVITFQLAISACSVAIYFSGWSRVLFETMKVLCVCRRWSPLVRGVPMPENIISCHEGIGWPTCNTHMLMPRLEPGTSCHDVYFQVPK